MTVAEMIEWLKTQDQGATVSVIVVEEGLGYKDLYPREVEFDPSLSMYIDLRGNPHVKPDAPYYNSRTLLLGEV